MINKLITYLFGDYQKKINASLFKNCLYIYIILKVIFWSLNFDILFGENCISYKAVESYDGYKHFAFLLYLSDVPAFSMTFLGLIFSLTAFSLFNKKSNYIMDLVIFILVLNLNTKSWTTLTAGDPLLANLCVLSIFLRKDFTKTQGLWGELKILLHNVSFIALIVQVCIVYFYSALAKWVDEDWLRGNAVHLVNKALHYSNSFLATNADSFYYVSFVITYLVLIYQSVFPVVVFLPRIKRYFLNLGILMHLYIAVVMGLFFFGLIMALTYVLFYDFNENNSHKVTKPQSFM